MRILISHDREDARKEIAELVSNLAAQNWKIDVAPDYVGTARLLKAHLYDLLILDLTLPHIEGRGQASHQVVANLLDELLVGIDLNIPGDLIGITRDVNALNSISNEIGPHLMAIVEEDGNGIWKKTLSDRIKYVSRSGKSRLASLFSQFDYDVAIITALDEEMAAYKGLFEFTAVERAPGISTFFFRDSSGIQRNGVACAIGRAGQAAAASKVQSIISNYRPSLIAMSGFCGGVENKIELGTIAIFETVFDWDYGKWKDDNGTMQFFARPEPISIRGSRTHELSRTLVSQGISELPSWISEARKRSPDLSAECKFVLATAASGSAVVGHKNIITQIRGLNDNIAAVDMESYGLYFSATHTYSRRPEMICVKSVADFCDGDKGDTLHAGCSFLSAKATEAILKNLWRFDEPSA